MTGTKKLPTVEQVQQLWDSQPQKIFFLRSSILQTSFLAG